MTLARCGIRLSAGRSTSTGAFAPDLSALMALLDIPVEDSTWQALDAIQRRQRTLDALKRLMLWQCSTTAGDLGLRGPALDRHRDTGVSGDADRWSGLSSTSSHPDLPSGV